MAGRQDETDSDCSFLLIIVPERDILLFPSGESGQDSLPSMGGNEAGARICWMPAEGKWPASLATRHPVPQGSRLKVNDDPLRRSGLCVIGSTGRGRKKDDQSQAGRSG